MGRVTAAAEQLTSPPQQFGIGLIGIKGEAVVVLLNSLCTRTAGRSSARTARRHSIRRRIEKPSPSSKKLAGFAPRIANVGEPEAVSAFTAGQVAMLLTGSWQQDTMNQRVDFDWRIAVLPAPEGKSFVGALGGWNFAINKNSQNKEAAFKLIEFLSTNKEVQKTINSLTPGMKEAGEEFVRERRKQPEVILETLNSGRPRPISPVYPQVSDIEQAMVQAVWAGTRSNRRWPTPRPRSRTCWRRARNAGPAFPPVTPLVPGSVREGVGRLKQSSGAHRGRPCTVYNLADAATAGWSGVSRCAGGSAV